MVKLGEQNTISWSNFKKFESYMKFTNNMHTHIKTHFDNVISG